MSFKRKARCCLVNPTLKKDKKTSVSFQTNPTIIETYSKEDYDRSGIFSSPTLYKFNSSRLPQLSLSIPPAPPLEEDDASSAEISPIPSPSKKFKKKPVLSIDTSLCSDPLFFSRLSTHYTSDSLENDFLISIV